jgi:hypothetical protein
MEIVGCGKQRPQSVIPGDKAIRTFHPDEPATRPIRSSGLDGRYFERIEFRTSFGRLAE